MHRAHTHVQEGSHLVSMRASAPQRSSPLVAKRGARALISVAIAAAALLLVAPVALIIWHWQHVAAHAGGWLLYRPAAAESPLHPLVLAEVDSLVAASDPGLHVQLQPIFGVDAVNRPLVTTIRSLHRRDAPRPPLLRQPGQRNDTPAVDNTCQRRRLRSKQPCSPAFNSTLPAGLPPDFDYQAYIEYHPELATSIRTPHEAAQHYLQHGAAQRSRCTRLRVIMRLTVWGGLFNQQYGYISAMMLAAASGAELVLPPAFTRHTFGEADTGHHNWKPLPLEELLDVERIQQSWQKRGVILHRTPPILDKPNRHRPNTVYPANDTDPALIVELPVNGYQSRDLDDVAETLRITAVGHAQGLMRQNRTSVPYVVVDVGGWVFSIRYTSSPRLAWQIASSLHFAPALRQLAARVARRMTAAEYNGLHLRVEEDMHQFTGAEGGVERMYDMYIDAMRALNYTIDTPAYVSSGLFGYNGTGADAITKKFASAGVLSAIAHKEQLLTPEELAGLTFIQQAAIDFLVTISSPKFVGFSASSFSCFIKYTRLQLGQPLTTNMLIGHAGIENAYKLL